MNLDDLLYHSAYPLSNKHDAGRVIADQMGLNPLWLTEWLCRRMDLAPGMRVLDLGCGKGLSSIFLAREYGVQVWATDLWVRATDNWKRIAADGLSDRIFPINADARDLPFAAEFFDAIVCIDAYVYFGTDDLYLDYLHRFVKPAGRVGIVVPGFVQEVDGPLPDHLRPFWAQECWTWHTADWWRRLWDHTGLVNVQFAEPMPDAWRLWLTWKRARIASGDESPSLRTDIAVLEQDAGR